MTDNIPTHESEYLGSGVLTMGFIVDGKLIEIHKQIIINSMDKNEAMTMMTRGHKVRHDSFVEGEYLTVDSAGRMIDEEKTIIDRGEFWSYRKGDEWETGWSLV